MYSILGRGSFCFNYSLNSAWHGGDQFVALLRWCGSPGSLSVGHSESRRMTDELGSRQRDLSTSSVTKRANGHWHAIIASSCRWSQREYKRQPVHRINHPFASEPSGGIHYCSSCPRVRNWASECGRYSTAAVVAVSREKRKRFPWRQ